MSVEKAKINYLERSAIDHRRMNCAEAVAYAFQETIRLPEEELKSYAGLGSGRAPEGYCGAFYAARRLLELSAPQRITQLAEVFQNAAGSSKCREIRALKRISCLACVEKAAETVSKL